VGLSVVCLILVWEEGELIPLYIGLSFVMAMVVLILTLAFFVPINKYILDTADYDPAELKKRVKKWVRMDYFRFFLLLLGLLAALTGMYIYLSVIS